MENIGFGKGQRRPSTVAEMRTHASRLRERADALQSRAWDRLSSVPSSMVTGGARYQKTFGKQNARNFAAMENAAEKAKALRQAAGKWAARADAIDPEVQKAKVQRMETESKAKATINDFVRETVKPGDLVYVGGNSPIGVKKVNAKSITCDSGTNWKFDEVSTHQTTSEMMAAFREWRNRAA